MLRTTDYSADIFNPGSAHAFALVGTRIRTTTITHQSAADINDTDLPQHFASAASAIAWRLSGMPSPLLTRSMRSHLRVPAGSFGFLSEGSPLTYADVMGLPPDKAVIAKTVRAHTDPRAQTSARLLVQYAFLLGKAPVSGPVHAAILRAMADLPGIELCARPREHVAAICVDEANDRYEVLLDIQHGTLVAIVERILAVSPLFPTMAAGSIVARDAFRILTGEQ